MVMTFNHTTPSPVLLRDIMAKVNALGHEPRVWIEFDKLVYVPGLKRKFESIEWVKSTSLKYRSAPPLDGGIAQEPDVSGGSELGDRFEYIKCAAKRAVQRWGLDNEAYLFLLAVCKHETGFGTLGMGRKEKGSFVLGYGCPSSCDPAYSGIDTQFYYGAKRYAEAMRSRRSAIASRGLTYDDVDYFHEGGDKGYGKWVWSADGPNWKKRVWQYYQEIRGEYMQLKHPNKWDCQAGNSIVPAGSVSSNPSSFGAMLKEIVFPIEGISFKDLAYVSSHHMNHRGGRPGHKGIDIVSKDGVNGKWVVAAFPGRVRKAYRSTTYGNVVMITHSNGYETVYAHMQDGSIQVRPGQYVNAGTRLGRVGSTGRSSGPHLHFEIWKGHWVYGGTNHFDPYWLLLGAQKVSAAVAPSNNSNSTYPQMHVQENVKFNKCFDKDGKLSSNWVDANEISWFNVPGVGKMIGYKQGSVKKGGHQSFGFKHNFSADGFFEWSYYCDLKPGDTVTVSVDGIVVAKYTEKDNGRHHSAPVHVRYVTDQEGYGFNSHVIDFHLESASGESVFGIMCFTCTEVEVFNGYAEIDEKIVGRRTYKWFETGGFVYEDTYYLDKDIIKWEINNHFDMRVATARITLDNRHGIYSPNYRRSTIFPNNLRESELSYFDGGKIRHVLSEGTPVRIYAGYGDNLVRVFTGRIKGEIEENSEERTITFTCVDMYDKLEEHVFVRHLNFPPTDEIRGDETRPLTMWVKSAIIHYIINEAGLKGWRIHEEDLKYPDAIIEETYYIDIDKGGTKAVVFDPKTQRFVEKEIKSIKTIGGYKNPYVEAVEFPPGTRAADAIQQLIGDIMYRAYCDRYGTFRLESIRDLKSNGKWEFIDGENLYSLDTSVDHSRVRNHLMIAGSAGRIEHFIDRDLFIATKGELRSARVDLAWIDESFGATARGMKEDVANKLFFDMKRQARTFNVVVKGNPLIDVLDGCYVYDQNTSSAGYYIIKGNRLVGNEEGMVNFLELTWEDDSISV